MAFKIKIKKLKIKDRHVKHVPIPFLWTLPTKQVKDEFNRVAKQLNTGDYKMGDILYLQMRVTDLKTLLERRGIKVRKKVRMLEI